MVLDMLVVGEAIIDEYHYVQSMREDPTRNIWWEPFDWRWARESTPNAFMFVVALLSLADFYALPVEQALAFAQAWEGDTRMVLLVVLALGAELTDDLLAPVGPRPILFRMLNNLLGIASREDDVTAMLRTLDAMLAVDPDAGRERVMRMVDATYFVKWIWKVILISMRATARANIIFMSVGANRAWTTRA